MFQELCKIRVAHLFLVDFCQLLNPMIGCVGWFTQKMEKECFTVQERFDFEKNIGETRVAEVPLAGIRRALAQF